MPQIKVNFGPKVGGAKKTFPPADKKAPGGLSKSGKVNPFLKNDAAKKPAADPKPADPAPEKVDAPKPDPPKEVTVNLASKTEVKVELPPAEPTPAPAPEPAKEPEAAPEPVKSGSKFYSVIFIFHNICVLFLPVHTLLQCSLV